MQSILISIGVLVLLALDWAALHDILKGNETSYVGEYTALAASAVIFAAAAAHWLRKRLATP